MDFDPSVPGFHKVQVKFHQFFKKVLPLIPPGTTYNDFVAYVIKCLDFCLSEELNHLKVLGCLYK